LRESAKAPSPRDEASFSVRKNYLRYSAFVCAGSGSRNVSNKRWLAPQCGLPAPPRNFPDNSEFTGNFQKLWLSATSETQIPASAKQGII
jgi:hypothetical protein